MVTFLKGNTCENGSGSEAKERQPKKSKAANHFSKGIQQVLFFNLI